MPFEVRVTDQGGTYDIPPIVETIGIPLFLLGMLVECTLALCARRPLYRANDSIASLSAGFVQVLAGRLCNNALNIIPYCCLFHYARLLDMGFSPWAHFLCFFMVDFSFYWFHRWVHECNFGWASHTTHHSSEEFNLSTALRQNAIQGSLGAIFNLWLAFFFHPALYALHAQINLIYQFFLHTELVGKLGPLEYIFNTPSAHRCHHGRNPKYLDKNYGGILIIFDIAFGTFVLEDETPVYGLVTPIQSFDPFYVQLHKFKENWDSCIEQPSVEKAVKVWVKGPAWNPAGGLYDAPEVDPQKVQKYDPKVPGRQQAFAIFTFVTALVFGLPVLQALEIPLMSAIWKVMYIIAALCTSCAVFNNRMFLCQDESTASWFRLPLHFWVEVVRLGLTIVAPGPMLTSRLVVEPFSWVLQVLSLFALVFVLLEGFKFSRKKAELI